VKPKKPLVYGGAAIMGLLLGVFAAVILDIRTGRILERWQLSRQLGLPVLAEVRRP
jgi:capsular polysaccharide biosynthesis protein